MRGRGAVDVQGDQRRVAVKGLAGADKGRGWAAAVQASDLVRLRLAVDGRRDAVGRFRLVLALDDGAGVQWVVRVAHGDGNSLLDGGGNSLWVQNLLGEVGQFAGLLVRQVFDGGGGVCGAEKGEEAERDTMRRRRGEPAMLVRRRKYVAGQRLSRHSLLTGIVHDANPALSPRVHPSVRALQGQKRMTVIAMRR